MGIETAFKRIRPGTFIDGEEYLLIEGSGSINQLPVLVPVKFIAYDPSPAFVIVRQDNRRLRRLRDDLYSFPV
jgi:hypothetical protein